MKNIKFRYVFIHIFLFVNWFPAISQDYTIGQGDILQITFWQQPDLNTQVKVNKNGEITLPVIGNIKALGLTPKKLGEDIVEKISIYNKDIMQTSVIVLGYGSNKIYVMGHVLSPGKYTFEEFPNLWEAILEAGGIAETAMLSNVSIIRGEIAREKNAQNIIIDLAQKIQNGDFSDLPILYPGDTIFVPGVTGEIVGGSSMGPNLNKNYIYIYGQVGKPGVYTLEQKMDLLRTLIVAGGPTPLANLEDVRIISQVERYPSVIKFNLKKFTSKGDLESILMNPGDTIYIPEKKTSIFAGSSGRIIVEILRVLVASGASALIYSSLR